MLGHYTLQRSAKGRSLSKNWLSFDYALDNAAAKVMLKKARRLFPDYAWRVYAPAECAKVKAQKERAAA